MVAVAANPLVLNRTTVIDGKKRKIFAVKEDKEKLKKIKKNLEKACPGITFEIIPYEGRHALCYSPTRFTIVIPRL